MDGSILAGCFENVVWVRVEGKGSFENSPRLRRFAEHVMAEGRNIIVVDLEHCPNMDSTFMGTLTGIALKLARIPGGYLEIINASDRTQDLLKNLGLDQILRVDIEGKTWADERKLVAANIGRPLPNLQLNKRERTLLVKEAHEALVQANDENFSRFQDVLAYLEQELESGED